MDLVNVQKSNSSFPFLVFSSKIHRFFKVKVHGWMDVEKSMETKISGCNHRWSEPKGFKTWLICHTLATFTLWFQTTKQSQEKVCLLKNADGFCSLQKAKNVSLWFANSANYTQKIWGISVGIEYSIIDTSLLAFWSRMFGVQKPIEFSHFANYSLSFILYRTSTFFVTLIIHRELFTVIVCSLFS